MGRRRDQRIVMTHHHQDNTTIAACRLATASPHSPTIDWLARDLQHDLVRGGGPTSPVGRFIYLPLRRRSCTYAINIPILYTAIHYDVRLQRSCVSCCRVTLSYDPLMTDKNKIMRPQLTSIIENSLHFPLVIFYRHTNYTKLCRSNHINRIV